MADPVVASHLSLVLKAPPTISSPSHSLPQQHSKPMASSLNSAASLRLFASSSSSSSSAAARLSLRSTSLSFSSSLKSLAFSPLSRHKRGSAVSMSSTGVFSSVASPKCAASDPDQLKSAREDIKELLKSKFCHPILVRLGWHDAGTYNKNIEEWPRRGGANGSLRFEVELKHAANAGLVNALNLIQHIKDKYSGVTYADLFQLASATAIEEAGGPKIPMKYGRVDVSGPNECPEEGRLPAAGPPSPADHLREVFYRMGLNDKKDGPGAPGGQSWTVQWLKFDNSYFKDIKAKRDEDLLVLPTDAVLFEDPSFKVYAEKYAEDQETFFKDYAEAHAKLSNLGAKFNPPEGIVLDDGPR
ncbi:probable L-ascorbate peroxidase 6, chloroplastic/mitochondrial isoform X2 [Gossypium arboreum]|uniref:probable L-ascorbate peroxidase 6, chloroplastic/mitochondrial isoform X2 n=1 Tax=Gossypium arboreum TaxID=29729 RepID=UPI0022F17D9F|nr:probable L-ascorbate peroxidase 6, chloroplastic/mitochondrial isoform X2 [Gossypium arboreum]